MGTKIKIPLILRESTGNRETVEVGGGTVRECMDKLIKQFPESREWFDENNPIVWIVLNQDLVNLTELDTKVSECDDLSLILVVGGG